MKVLKPQIDCPNCGVHIVIPMLPEIKAQAEANWDLDEETAQDDYNSLLLWLYGASLWQLVKFWFEHKKLRR